MTITGSGCVVLKLTDFTLNNKDTLTLQGTAGTAFIINVSNHFSLTDQAKIVLSGGVSSSDVLFNVRGTGGGDVKLDKQSRFTGILMANQRDVAVKDDAVATGEIIANHIDLTHNAQVIHPPTVSN
jgi:choice-of-anchor A domain-containing protein